jgi:response regulator RpfG family c-di-GMP phosphodiesterase
MSGVVFVENLRKKHNIQIPLIIYTTMPKREVWPRLSTLRILNEDYVPKPDSIDPNRSGFPEKRDTYLELKEAVDRHILGDTNGVK